MAFPRHSHHATLLPDGRVLITGGTDKPGLFQDEPAGILTPEIWDSTTETFETAAPMAEAHHFQSAAVLLPDARVLVAGGRFGNPDVEPHFSWSGQVYSPPYLDEGPRPTISKAPPTVAYGGEFTIETPGSAAVSEVVLIGLSASRIGWNSNQRLVRLSVTIQDGGVRATAPSNPDVAPPGPYLLFLLNGRGVPSTGVSLRLYHE
jgi:hypothetical protein